MVNRHILLVTSPSQGHLNPSLQFAKRLLQMGVQVTLATGLSAHQRISKIASAPGLTFSAFYDGCDDGFNLNVDRPEQIMSEIRNHGSHTVKQIIAASAEQGRPISCLVYTPLLTWAATVARELHVPSALLWTQPASVMDIYYNYFNGYDEIISANVNDPLRSIDLPGLPLLKARDLPSFMLPSDPHKFALPSIKEQLETLDEQNNPLVLLNTFDALEPDALRVLKNIKMIGVGPLIPPAFMDGHDGSGNCFGSDSLQKSTNYIDFLNSKSEASVIYVSFGSILVLKNAQLEEIARAILETGRPFLWVIRSSKGSEENKERETLSFMDELGEQGMIVPWCAQLEVLSHPSLGCFVTHCGWNSTLESLACGVPVVAFPRWMEQRTNAKLIEDVWGTGVRVRANEDGRVESDEIKRCVEMVIDGGEKGAEFRRNAMKWKDLARGALKDGGSSDKNLKEFVQELGKGCHDNE